MSCRPAFQSSWTSNLGSCWLLKLSAKERTVFSLTRNWSRLLRKPPFVSCQGVCYICTACVAPSVLRLCCMWQVVNDKWASVLRVGGVFLRSKPGKESCFFQVAVGAEPNCELTVNVNGFNLRVLVSNVVGLGSGFGYRVSLPVPEPKPTKLLTLPLSLPLTEAYRERNATSVRLQCAAKCCSDVHKNQTDSVFDQRRRGWVGPSQFYVAFDKLGRAGFDSGPGKETCRDLLAWFGRGWIMWSWWLSRISFMGYG